MNGLYAVGGMAHILWLVQILIDEDELMTSGDSGQPGPVGQLLRLPLRLIPKEATVRIMHGPLRGTKWVSGSSTHGWWLGRYEMDKQWSFSRHVRPGDVVYDLGANVGFYSLLASAAVGPSGQVHAFEPFPDNVKRIEKHLELNHVSNCKVHACAVSDVCGFATFETNPLSNAMGQLSQADGLRVRVASVDEIVESKAAPPPSVIKVDIEGSEYRMFKGAASVLAKYKPSIFLATHSAELRKQCHDFLRSLGYKVEPIGDAPLAECDEIMATVAELPSSSPNENS